MVLCLLPCGFACPVFPRGGGAARIPGRASENASPYAVSFTAYSVSTAAFLAENHRAAGIGAVNGNFPFLF